MNAIEYANAISDTVRKLSELQKKMAELEDVFSGQKNTLEALRKKHELLKEVLEKQTAKQEILARALKEAEQSQMSSKEQTEKLRQSLGDAEAQIVRTNKEIANNKKYMREAENSTDHCAKSINRYGEETNKAKETTEKWVNSIRNSVVTRAITDLSEGAKKLASSAYEAAQGMEQSANRIEASTGISGTALREYQKVMEDVYRNNYGGSFDEVAQAVSQVVYHMGELDGNAMQEVTENAFALKDTFEMDVNETLRSASVLMTDMGINSDEAFGLIARGAQNGMNKSGDLLSSIAEYGKLWGDAGFLAQEMFSAMENGLNAGANDFSEVNHLLEEFMGALSDGRVEKSLSGFSEGTQKLFGQMQAGETTAAEVFQGVINDLSSAENQQKALTLAGSIWGSAGEEDALKILTSLNDVNDSYSGVMSTMNELKEVRYDDLGSQISQIGRTIQVQLGEHMQKILPALSGGLEFLSDNLVAVEASVAGVGTAIAILQLGKLATWIGNFVNGLEGATLAMKAFNLVMSAGTLGVVATVAGLAVAGLTAFAFSAGEAETESQKAYNEMKNLSKEAKNLKNNVQESKAAMEEETRSTVSQYLAYDAMSDRLYKLNDQLVAGTLNTKEELAVKKEMQYLVNELNSAIPELNLHMDEQTGIMKNSKAATDECIASMKKKAIASMMEERMTELYRQQGEALMMQGEATAKRNAAQKNAGDIMTRAEKSLAAYTELMGEYNTRADASTMTAEEWGKVQEEIANRHGVTVDEMVNGCDAMERAIVDTIDYNSVIAESEKVIEDATNAQKDAQTMMDESAAGMIESMRLMGLSEEEIEEQAIALGINTDALQTNNEATKDNTGLLQDNTSATEENKASVEASTEAQKKALQSLKEKYEEIRGSIEQSMEQKISLFDEFDGGETIGLDKIKENLDSQLTGLTNWRDNMAQLAGQVGENISAELYNHLVELGPDAANIVQEMVNSLDPDKGDGGEQLKQIAERYSELLDIKESAAENIADVSFIIQSALGEISEASALDFENLMTSLDEAKEKASEKGLGISEGLEESFHATVETLRECGAQIPEGLAEALANGEITIEDAIGQMQGSIEAQFSYLSGIAQKAGIPIPEGIREGIVQGGDAAIQAMNQLMGLLTGAQEEGRAELRESSCKSGEVIGDGAAQGAEDSSAKVSQEAADIAKKAVEVMNAYKDSFKNAGYNMMSKFASGLNEGSELVYSKIREIRQRLENEVNNLGKKNTSSKPSQTGGTKPTAKTITPSLNQAKQDDTIPFSLNGDMPGSSLAKQSGEIPLFSNTPNLNTSKVSKKFRQTVKKKIKSGLAFGVQKGNGDKDGKELAEQVAERTEKFIEENAGSYAEANVVWKALLKKAKGSKIEGYEKNIKKLVSEQRKKKREEDQKYGASGDALEEYKKVRDVSAKAEVEYWEIVCSQYKKGTEERLKADKNYLEALKTYNEKWKDLKDDYLQKCQEINEQLEKERQEEYDSAIQNRKSAIRSAFGLFDAFHSEADAPEVLLANMQSQAAGYALWMTELEKLEKKGILNEAFLEELREMGPGGAATILSLGRMTDEQLKKANETYEQLDNLAEEQARREVERQESQTQKRIAELEKAAEEEKKRWYEEYKAAEQELSQPIDESLKKLAKKASAIGEQTAVNFISQLRSDKIKEEVKNAGAEMAKEFREGFGELTKKKNTVGDGMISGILKEMDSHLSIRLGAEDLVAKIEEEIKKSAEINSPSRRFRRTIGVQIPAGVAEGIEENTQTAARAGTYMVGTMLEQAKEKLGEQQMTLTGEMQRINGGAGIAALNHLASENVGGQANVTVNNSGVAEMLGGVMAEMKAIGQEIRYMKVVLDTGEFVGAVAPAMGDELARQAMRF